MADALVGGGDIAAAAAAIRALPAPAEPITNPIISAFSAPPPHTFAGPLPPPTDATGLMIDFVARDVLKMTGVAGPLAPPDVIDAAHVQSLLTQPYGIFPACKNTLCVGLEMPGRFALRQYMSPRQMAHYHVTGQAPPSDDVCYLCALAFALAAVGMGGTVSLPFMPIVNAPGGYVPEALHASQLGDGVLHPIRRLMLSDYSLVQTVVHEAAAYDASGVVSQWTSRSVMAYSEDASLLFSAGARPVPRTVASPYALTAVSALPSCESVIFRKLDVPVNPMQLDYVESVSREIFHLATPLAATLGGVVAPPTIDMPAPGATTQHIIWALTLRPLPESRAVLLYLVSQNGNNWAAVAQRHRLLPVQCDQGAAIERERPLKTHMLLYLVFARCAEIDRMLADGATEIGATAALGRADAVQLALGMPGASWTACRACPTSCARIERRCSRCTRNCCAG